MTSMTSLIDDDLAIPYEATTNPPVPLHLVVIQSSDEDGDSKLSLATTSKEKNSKNLFPLSRETCRRPHGRGWLVGRQVATVDIRVAHASLSRQHAFLYYFKSGDDHRSDQKHDNMNERNNLHLFVKDLGGRHGTFVNGTRVDELSTTELKENDALQFGKDNTQYRVKTAHRDQKMIDNSSDNLPSRSDSEVGEELTGRAKRQAEITAMTESLDHAPTYNARHPGASSSTTENSQSESADSDDTKRLAQHYGLPMTNQLTIPSEISARRGAVTCFTADSSGSRFTVGSTDTHLRFYDCGGMRKHRLESFLDVIPEERQILQSVVFSPSGDKILVGTSSVQPRVLDREGQLIIQFCRGDMYVQDPNKTIGHTAQVTSVDWHPLDRDRVITASLDGSARLWNLNGKTQFDMLVCEKVFLAKSEKGQRTAVTSVTFHPGGHEFAIGTRCGSIQIWNRVRISVTRPDRAIYHAHIGKHSNDAMTCHDLPITSLVYSNDGTQLASRSHSDSRVLVWDPFTLSHLSIPRCICMGLNTIHDNANISWNPDGSILCAGESSIISTSDGKQESGTVLVFQLPSRETLSAVTPSLLVHPIFTFPIDNTAPVIVLWHTKLNQILVACSDGRIIIFFDSSLSGKGGGYLIASHKVGRRDTNDLTKLLQIKAESSTVTGEIFTPLSMPRGERNLQQNMLSHLDLDRKKQRLERKDPIKSHEPERPASGKHKMGGQDAGNRTFQQFVADQRMSKTRAIAGKDPREALFLYNEGKNYVKQTYEGNTSHLADKTAEQEDEERRAKKR